MYTLLNPYPPTGWNIVPVEFQIKINESPAQNGGKRSCSWVSGSWKFGQNKKKFDFFQNFFEVSAKIRYSCRRHEYLILAETSKKFWKKWIFFLFWPNFQEPLTHEHELFPPFWAGDLFIFIWISTGPLFCPVGDMG